MVRKTCPICGRQKPIQYKICIRKKPCCEDCAKLAPIPKYDKCQVCGGSFTKKQIVHNNKYCSRKCYLKALRSARFDTEEAE